MEAAAGSSSSGGGGGGRVAIMTSPAAAAEKKLNSFIRTVALFERLGNALGTLAFTWATVVLLGGYPTVLSTGEDFAFVTVVILLEALRMFSRDNRMDYQIFFRSRGSVRPLGWSGLIAVACICNVLELLAYLCGSAYGSGWAVWIRKLIDALIASAVLLTVVIGKLLSPGVLKHVPRKVRRFISLGSPFAAVLLLVPSLLKAAPTKQSHMVVNWIMFTLLLVAVFLLTLSRLVDAGMGNKYVFWRRIILNICIFAELVMLVFIHGSLRERIVMTIFQAYVLLCVSFGNLLLPTAILRVAIALKRLVPHDYSGGGSEEQLHESRINLAPSLDIFYMTVLGQGMLYLVSCTLEMFSCLPRRSLARKCGFRGYQGVESVNLYYEYAMDKCMERDVVAQKEISLDSFAIHSVSSDSPKLQLNGVWMMHILLRQELSRAKILSKLHRDANAIPRLINMLEWRRPEDAAIRLLAAKVTAVLAGTLRVVSIPGAMQALSALLDADDSDGTETESGQDILPGLALSIFGSLASNSNYDFHGSCLEISRAAEDIFPKIIQFTCYRNDGNGTREQNTNEAAATVQKKIFLMESALQLLGRLSSISGKIGVTLRHELMEYPILLTNLSAISEDRFSSQKARKLAVVILSILTE